MIYLDNAATTKIDDSVLEEMMPYLTGSFGNPGSIHNLGRKAKDAICLARQRVASLVNSTPEHIIFTASGSEANNMVFLGIKEYLKSVRKTHILVSAVEHESVLKASESLIKDGFDVEYIPVLPNGKVDLDVLERRITPFTGLVSIMYVNNEIGSINDIHSIARMCNESGVLFHTDCVQAAKYFDIDVDAIGCDFLTISSHKLNGPKGCGALYCKDKELLAPICYGGKAQEFGLRCGTENVPAIVGFGKACENIKTPNGIFSAIDSVSYVKYMFYRELRYRLLEYNLLDRVVFNSDPDEPGSILNLNIIGLDGETTVLALANKDICISSGAACTSHESVPSHVLKAIGLSDEDAMNSIRVSFSNSTDICDAYFAAHILVSYIKSAYEDNI